MSISSNLSKIIITSVPYFEVNAIGDSFSSVVEKYSLNNITSHLNLNAESLEAEFVRNGCKRTNDRIACECVKKICQDIDPSREVKAACELDGLKELSLMTASCDQKPDIIILSDDVVGFTAEVHSSPMVYTITKACIGTAD